MMFSLFSVLVAIALVDFVHCVVVSEEIFNVLFVVVDFVAYAGVGQGPVGTERLEGAGTDVQDLHDVLTVEKIAYKIGWRELLGFHFLASFLFCPKSCMASSTSTTILRPFWVTAGARMVSL